MHPTTRSERRSVRDLYITRRKYIHQHIWRRSIPEWDADNPPPIHVGYTYNSYLKWLEWQKYSEEDIKTLEVMAKLDNKELEIPTDGRTAWGRYAKFNLTCQCRCCKHNARNRRKDMKLLLQLHEEDLDVYNHR